MKSALHGLVAVLAMACAASTPTTAHAQRGWHHHHGSHVFVGIGLGWGYYGPWYYPGYVLVEPAPVVVAVPADPLPTAPAPVVTPRQGQTPEQIESDWQQCGRLATTQPAAIADAAEFQRSVIGCMHSRGYGVK